MATQIINEAIEFAKWIKKNYSIVKGGKYRHRGDFFKNHKLKNENQLYDEFTNTHKDVLPDMRENS